MVDLAGGDVLDFVEYVVYEFEVRFVYFNAGLRVQVYLIDVVLLRLDVLVVDRVGDDDRVDLVFEFFEFALTFAEQLR